MWNRQQIELSVGVTVVDTGLIQTNLNFDPDPPLFGSLLNASRVMVVPLMPIDAWLGVTHSEPAQGPTGTVEVIFVAPALTTINVLFWNPHTHISPGDAVFYNGPPCSVTAVIAIRETSCTVHTNE
ncbi:hypothetical protein LCGC14_0630580 [marine sediment metagenome]|uniref:Uncharacterized protein n=1 Tax=marine sediment metagenome TaxID=412755 RepID=A0A0F9TNE2_9ZZZZ